MSFKSLSLVSRAPASVRWVSWLCQMRVPVCVNRSLRSCPQWELCMPGPDVCMSNSNVEGARRPTATPSRPSTYYYAMSLVSGSRGGRAGEGAGAKRSTKVLVAGWGALGPTRDPSRPRPNGPHSIPPTPEPSLNSHKAPMSSLKRCSAVHRSAPPAPRPIGRCSLYSTPLFELVTRTSSLRAHTHSHT